MDKNKKNKALYLSILIIFFILGWFLNSTFETLKVHKEKPFFGDEERYSPHDVIKEEDLQLDNDRLVINFPGLALAQYADTNSMDPLLDEHATGLEIIPESEEDIFVGDVIAYQSGDDLIVHRIVLISKDDFGWYAVVKGDNSETYNPERIRFEQVKYLLVGVLY